MEQLQECSPGMSSLPEKQADAASATVAKGGGATFQLQHATESRVVKGEDVVFVHPLHGSYPGAMLYMVCDGHSGVKAAQFVCRKYHSKLAKLLPEAAPDFGTCCSSELQEFARQLRSALCEAFITIDNEWRTRNDTAGTTVTVMVVTGGLVTVANVGDSAAVLDTGCSMLELTRSHRIHTDDEERARLKAAGCTVASLGFHLQGPAVDGEPGVGPLRIWPGGLCVSRSVGDTDAGPHIVPIPHVKQVLVPQRGCRVIIASDGLWDTMSYSRAVSLVRNKTPHAAAVSLVETASKDVRVVDDTTVIVVDVLPSPGPDHDFPMVARRMLECHGGAAGASERRRSASGRLIQGLGLGLGLFACFQPELEEPDAREAEGPGFLALYADVDCLAEDPTAVPRLRRTTEAAPPPKVKVRSRPPSARRPGLAGPAAWGSDPPSRDAPGTGAGFGVGSSVPSTRPASASVNSTGAVGLVMESDRDSPGAMSWALQERHSGVMVRMATLPLSRGASGHIPAVPAVTSDGASREPSTRSGTAFSGSMHGGSRPAVGGSWHGGKSAGGSLYASAALREQHSAHGGTGAYKDRAVNSAHGGTAFAATERSLHGGRASKERSAHGGFGAGLGPGLTSLRVMPLSHDTYEELPEVECLHLGEPTIARGNAGKGGKGANLLVLTSTQGTSLIA